jgi:hypothetical protein
MEKLGGFVGICGAAGRRAHRARNARHLDWPGCVLSGLGALNTQPTALAPAYCGGPGPSPASHNFLKLLTTSHLLGRTDMMSLSGLLKPSAVAGRPSVTRLTHSSCKAERRARTVHKW